MIDRKNLLARKIDAIGEFWFPNSNIIFSGRLLYSPKKGIRLKLASSKREVMKSPKIVYGNVRELGEITLFARRSLSYSSTQFITERNIDCVLAICGGHFSENDQFHASSFRYSLVDEFCYPRGFKLDDTLSFDDKLSAQLPNKTIELGKNFSGTFSSPKWMDGIDHQNLSREKKENIDKEIEEVFIKHGVEFPSTVTDVYYEFFVDYAKESRASIKVIIDDVTSIESLFSLLLMKHIFPLSITIYDKKNDEKRRAFPVLYSQYLTSSDLRQLKDGYINHNHLAVTKKYIENNFEKIIKEWTQYNSLPNNNIISTLLNHLDYSKNHMQHFILLLASIEQCSIENNKDHSNKTKYQWAIENYGSKDLFFRLKSILNISDEKYGDALSKIRAILVHPKSLVNKSKAKYASICNETNIANINELLFLILLIYLYQKLGVDNKVILKLKVGFNSFRPTYYKVDI